jgi:hypothetical protein
LDRQGISDNVGPVECAELNAVYCERGSQVLFLSASASWNEVTYLLCPLGRASIRVAGSGFQTQGHVDEVFPGAIVISMCKEFDSILASGMDFIFENVRPEARPAFRALPRDAALDVSDPFPLDSLDFNEGL